MNGAKRWVGMQMDRNDGVTLSPLPPPPAQQHNGGSTGGEQRDGQSSPNVMTVLCLGMSYADLGANLELSEASARARRTRRGPSSASRATPSEAPPQDRQVVTLDVRPQLAAWEDAVRAVQLGQLTEMDGRDLARCLAVEECGGRVELTKEDDGDGVSRRLPARVYTASQETGAIYRSDRHMHGNFCRPGWARQFAERFPGVQLDQVVLDYFWIPTGWDASHWTRSLFERTLPDLCQFNLLRRPGDHPSKATTTIVDSGSSNLEGPSVYLPFCYHCFQMILACRDSLLQHYDISFVRKHELDQVALWRGTQTIEPNLMQFVLGKRLDQEEVYCRMGDFVRKIQEQELSSIVPPQVLLEYARRIPNADDIRFIALRPVDVHGGVLASSSLDRLGSSGGGGGERNSLSKHRRKKTLPGRILGLVDLPVKTCLAVKYPSAKRSLVFLPTSAERKRRRRQEHQNRSQQESTNCKVLVGDARSSPKNRSEASTATTPDLESLSDSSTSVCAASDVLPTAQNAPEESGVGAPDCTSDSSTSECTAGSVSATAETATTQPDDTSDGFLGELPDSDVSAATQNAVEPDRQADSSASEAVSMPFVTTDEYVDPPAAGNCDDEGSTSEFVLGDSPDTAQNEPSDPTSTPEVTRENTSGLSDGVDGLHFDAGSRMIKRSSEGLAQEDINEGGASDRVLPCSSTNPVSTLDPSGATPDDEGSTSEFEFDDSTDTTQDVPLRAKAITPEGACDDTSVSSEDVDDVCVDASPGKHERSRVALARDTLHEVGASYRMLACTGPASALARESPLAPAIRRRRRWTRELAELGRSNGRFTPHYYECQQEFSYTSPRPVVPRNLGGPFTSAAAPAWTPVKSYHYPNRAQPMEAPSLRKTSPPSRQRAKPSRWRNHTPTSKTPNSSKATGMSTLSSHKRRFLKTNDPSDQPELAFHAKPDSSLVKTKRKLFRS